MQPVSEGAVETANPRLDERRTGGCAARHGDSDVTLHRRWPRYDLQAGGAAVSWPAGGRLPGEFRPEFGYGSPRVVSRKGVQNLPCGS